MHNSALLQAPRIKLIIACAWHPIIIPQLLIVSV